MSQELYIVWKIEDQAVVGAGGAVSVKGNLMRFSVLPIYVYMCFVVVVVVFCLVIGVIFPVGLRERDCNDNGFL